MTLVFFDDFETDDFSNWTSSTSGTYLTTSGAAALAGSFGVDIAAGCFGCSDQASYSLPGVAFSDHWRMGCLFDKHNIVLTSGQYIEFLTLDGNPTFSRVCEFRLINSGGLKIQAYFNLDVGDTTLLSGVIGTGTKEIEVRMVRASSSVASDGEIYLYIDGGLEDSATGLDNYDAIGDLPSGTFGIDEQQSTGDASSGSFYIDNASLRNDDTPIFPPAASTYGPAAMSKPADVGGAGDYLYIAALNGTNPVLLKMGADLSANATVVFNPGSGSDIGVECGRQDSEVVWIAGGFDGTNTVEVSDDGGGSFTVADDGSFNPVTAFEVGPGVDDDRVMIVDNAADAYETFDAGGSWFARGSALITDEVKSLRRLGANPDEVLIGGEQAATDLVNYSPNALVSVSDISGILPPFDVKTLVFE